MSRTVLVCGGRSFENADVVYGTLDGLLPSRVVHGGATGADALARKWALSSGVVQVEYPAQWGRHGKAAGPIRNQTMLDTEKPDVVVAFPGGRGTADMVRRARAAGVLVIQVIS